MIKTQKFLKTKGKQEGGQSFIKRMQILREVGGIKARRLCLEIMTKVSRQTHFNHHNFATEFHLGPADRADSVERFPRASWQKAENLPWGQASF